MFLRDNYERLFEGIKVAGKGIGHKWSFSSWLFPMWDFSSTFRGTLDEYFMFYRKMVIFYFLLQIHRQKDL